MPYAETEGPMAKLKLEAVVTCPQCHFSSPEVMPTTFCLIRYQCKNCHAILTPKEGDDCIFCSWSDSKCPMQQQEPTDSAKSIFHEH